MGTVLIPALGLSERFAAEGYKGPKALLPITLAGERLTMIRRIARTVPRGWRILLMVPADYREDFVAALSPSDPIDIIGIHGRTEGQSDTIFHGLSYCLSSDPVMIQNCDVVFDPIFVRILLNPPPVMYNRVVLHQDTGDDPIFSYVNEFLNPEIFAEKQRISEWAMTGMWLFRRVDVIRDALQKQMEEGLRHTNGEFYLSGALNFVEETMHGSLARSTDWVDLGTPDAIRRAGGIIG